MSFLLLGFFTGLSLIFAIGAQNIFVIEQGLKKHWCDWLRGLDLNQRPSGYEPDARTFLPVKLTQHIK